VGLDNRNRLSNKLIYVQLLFSLTPKEYGGVANSEVKEMIQDLYNWIKNSTDEELSKKENEVNEFLDSIIDKYKDKFENIKDIDTIANEFNSFFKCNKNVYSKGVEYGWLIETFNHLKLPYPNYLPYQTKIGLGIHAGKISVEEEFLLKDAFYLLVKAEDTFDKMHRYANFVKGNENNKGNQYILRALTNANQTVATYSRLSIISFYSFFEAFINSIGYDYYCRNIDRLTKIQKNNLLGRKDDKPNDFLSIEEKIERLQQIIREDKTVVLRINKKKRTSNDYRLFFGEMKKLRNSSVHFSPNKESIWRKPDDWIEKAHKTSILTLQISREIWKAIFPTKNLPEYLNELKFELNYNLAKQRLQDVGKVENKEIISD